MPNPSPHPGSSACPDPDPDPDPGRNPGRNPGPDAGRLTATVELGTAPSLPLLHAALLLAGLGTFLLGPILPLLSARWHLGDARAGLLLLSQFLGATVGGVTVSARLRRGLAVGLLCAAAGLLGLAGAPSLLPACLALLVAGFGIGRVITTSNLVAGARFAFRRSQALTWLNLSFSFGALLSPLLALGLTPRVPLPRLLSALALLFLLVAGTLALQLHGASVEADFAPAEEHGAKPFARGVFVYFAVMICLYGGLETCFNSWLTTFATREVRSTLTAGQGALVLFLLGLNAGRALSGWLLARMADRVLQRAALLLSVLLGAVLATLHEQELLAPLAVLLGVALAPLFPVTFAMFLAHRPPARLAGIVLAASGIGAAAFGWAMGALSSASGSLRLALTVPIALAAGLLLLSLAGPRPPLETVSISAPPVGV